MRKKRDMSTEIGQKYMRLTFATIFLGLLLMGVTEFVVIETGLIYRLSFTDYAAIWGLEYGVLTTGWLVARWLLFRKQRLAEK